MISESIIEPALWAAAISTGLMAGIYFAFSMFVMTALQALPYPMGIAAMNSINRVIIKSAFIPLFFGSSGLALLLILFASSVSPWVPSAGGVYLLGMLACTIVFNVPLNNQLRDMATDNSSQVWQHYLIYWTRWNHIRTLSSLTACLLYLLALTQHIR
ncbi:DUF1772 domain-containing protein [Amphritea atlantica]|uniref:DUF1772 domain-containing protein n=1 Tax=Amphritea atlantica TaxID=355243 RepID=A0ABY5GXP5_9GAMM|nr:DUF1772 domain-containing protein [Amphritea atlantica]